MYSQDNRPGDYDYRPGGRNVGQAERNELFEGRQMPKPVNYDEMDNDQLVQHAENVHKGTTVAAQRALKVGRRQVLHNASIANPSQSCTF